MAAYTIWSSITCQFENFDIFSLSTHYFLLKDMLHRDDRQYFNCLLTRERVQMTTKFGMNVQQVRKLRFNRTKVLPAETLNVTHNDIVSCLPLIKQKCSNASLVVNKYIRMTMEMASEILRERSKTERIKIIHLYRDPRAVLDSQLRKNNLNVSHFPNFEKSASSMCKTMLEDFHIAVKLKLQYPNTIHTIRYETLQHSPLNVTRDLFNFLELPYLKSDELFVKRKQKTSTKKPIWRKHIPAKHLQVIDKYCHQLYSLFGYIPLNKISDVRNPNINDHVIFR